MTGVPSFGGASVDDPVLAGLPCGLAAAFGPEDDADGVGGVVPVETPDDSAFLGLPRGFAAAWWPADELDGVAGVVPTLVARE